MIAVSLDRKYLIDLPLDKAISYALKNHWNVRVVQDRKKAALDNKEAAFFVSLVVDSKGKVTDYYYG